MKTLRLLIFFFSAVSYGCSDDVLDKEPLDFLSDAAVWADPDLSDNYLDQLYAEMVFAWEVQYGGTSNADVNAYQGLYTWFEQVQTITIGDEARAGWVGAPKSNQIGLNGGRLEWWAYPTIRRMNEFISRMDTETQLDESYRIQRKAEARYLRAHVYFNMVKRYGGVPLITKVQQLSDPEEELFPARNSEQSIFDFILEELDLIMDDLTDTEEGRVTKWTALALKSRAAMYAGSVASFGTIQLDGILGIPSGDASSYWQASIEASEEIMTTGGFALYEVHDDKEVNFRNIFLDEDNSEIIFAEKFDGLAGKGHTYDMLMMPSISHIWTAGHQTNVYLDFIESFDYIDGSSGIIDRDRIAQGYLWTIDELWGDKDPRFRASVFTHGTFFDGSYLDFHRSVETPEGAELTSGVYNDVLARAPGTANASTPFGVLKYLDEDERGDKNHERNNSDTDYVVFRYAEILLNYAEAAIELGRTSDALDAINQIRARAGMPAHTSIDRNLIRKERKVELAFEGNRYWDVRRWRIAEAELSKAFNGMRIIMDGSSWTNADDYDVSTARFKVRVTPNIDGGNTPFFDERHYYFPIGLSRTGQNANLLPENPGYEN